MRWPGLFAVGATLVGAIASGPAHPSDLNCSGDRKDEGICLAVAPSGGGGGPKAPNAQELSGTASVIDGDTLEIRGTRVRLHGVDAPESSQTCKDGSGKHYRCGQQAALKLSEFIVRRPVACSGRDIDRYGRIIAVCTIGAVDLGEWLVREGLAVAYRRYSLDYVAAEQNARVAKRGIWAGEFEMPSDYRKKKR